METPFTTFLHRVEIFLCPAFRKKVNDNDNDNDNDKEFI